MFLHVTASVHFN